MALALAEAARGLGRTTPNPPVGCVIVQENKVVGRGFHPKAGEPHAEVFALREAGQQAQKATAYVTLEPCSHYGRTPPCAEALIKAGIAKVVVAALDPNPKVNGRGIQKMKNAGIEVVSGVYEAEATQQQAGFRSLITRGRPHVIYKYATTLDGKVAAQDESNGAVTFSQARQKLMQWRNEVDAIAVGRQTIQLDNPQLTTRGIENGRNPRPVVFDRQAKTKSKAKALHSESIVVCLPEAMNTELEDSGITLLRAQHLNEALTELGRLNISTLLLEGGPTLASAFFEAGLIDEVRAFVAPKLLGAGLSPLLAPIQPMQHAKNLQDVKVEQVGVDVLITGFLQS